MLCIIQGDQKVSVHLMIIVQKTLGITDGISVNLVSVNVWRLAGDTLNITCNFLYCNHQVHRDFLITLYMEIAAECLIVYYMVLY
jgi:hypothetical protein